MKQAIKKKWLAALRSGDYKQTKEALRDEEGFCCLGVLCDVHRIENKKRWQKGFNYYDENTILPHEIVNWAGLKNCNPGIEDSSICISTLADLNDEGKTFKEIADIIEKQL